MKRLGFTVFNANLELSQLEENIKQWESLLLNMTICGPLPQCYIANNPLGSLSDSKWSPFGKKCSKKVGNGALGSEFQMIL
jgi:hypothetical protein